MEYQDLIIFLTGYTLGWTVTYLLMKNKNYDTYTTPDKEVEKLKARLAKAEELLRLFENEEDIKAEIKLAKAIRLLERVGRNDSTYADIQEFLTSTNAGESNDQRVE